MHAFPQWEILDQWIIGMLYWQLKLQADTEVYRFDWYLIPMFFAFEFYLVFLFLKKSTTQSHFFLRRTNYLQNTVSQPLATTIINSTLPG